MLRALASYVAALTALPILFSCRPSTPAPEPSGETLNPVVLDASEQPLNVIAFGSCARQNLPQPIWEPIIAQQPDVFLFIGDNVYADTEDMQIMRNKYAELGEQPGFQQLRATTPVLATWDDHDYGVNDGGREYPMREESQVEFLTFFQVPRSAPPWERPGIYDAHITGPEGKRVQLILLDTRYFRSPLERWPEGERPKGAGPYRPGTDPHATMLGEDQWRWLEEQLEQPADVRIIASSIQVIPEEHGWEMWGTMPRERQRLLDLIRDTEAEGVILISGDRHLAEISRLEADAPNGVGYELYDVTSSGMTENEEGPVREPNRHRLGANYRGTNFGVIAIDWEQPDPTIHFRILGLEGQVLLEQAVRLSALRPRDD